MSQLSRPLFASQFVPHPSQIAATSDGAHTKKSNQLRATCYSTEFTASLQHRFLIIIFATYIDRRRESLIYPHFPHIKSMRKRSRNYLRLKLDVGTLRLALALLRNQSAALDELSGRSEPPSEFQPHPCISSHIGCRLRLGALVVYSVSGDDDIGCVGGNRRLPATSTPQQPAQDSLTPIDDDEDDNDAKHRNETDCETARNGWQKPPGLVFEIWSPRWFLKGCASVCLLAMRNGIIYHYYLPPPLTKRIPEGSRHRPASMPHASTNTNATQIRHSGCESHAEGTSVLLPASAKVFRSSHISLPVLSSSHFLRMGTDYLSVRVRLCVRLTMRQVDGKKRVCASFTSVGAGLRNCTPLYGQT